jgi:hypothetical protein
MRLMACMPLADSLRNLSICCMQEVQMLVHVATNTIPEACHLSVYLNLALESDT